MVKMPNNEGFDKNGNTQIDSIGKMLDSVKELRKLVDKDGKKSSIYFRGQEWKDKEDKDLQLLPAIGRKQKFCGEELEFDLESEVNLLHRFRRWAYLELKRPIGEWEALFLARHHRLPVRLLDWTSNPLFALYFASECEKPQGDAAV
ncbi:MAG: FRG domain-containing protein [Dehalococcoidales bacterium]|nr:FRG domain-containing protein [Dehalococcoidales bacterium]